MSRCFPFPPPGYERKHRPEDLDLLKEAERHEKRHKKEKKDKERRKNKEKKERDGSNEKHRDKKDRKGKHKDKKENHKDKKDKEDRGKDKEKSSISEESTVAPKLEEESREKLNPRVFSNDKNSVSDDGKNYALFQGIPFQNNLPSQETKESKFVQELDRRIRADETSRGSQLPVGVAGLDKRSQESATRAAVRYCSGISAEEKIYSKDKVDRRKMDVQGFRNEVGGNAMVHNLTTTGKSQVEGIPKPMEEPKDRKWGGKEKYKEIGDNEGEGKHKNGDKKSHGKGKDSEKEKAKEKATVKIENKKIDQDRPKHKENNAIVSVSGNKSSDLLKEPKNSTINDGNIQKRKEVVTNGFLLESEIRPPKMPRPAHMHSMENGRKYEGYQTPNLSISDKDMVPNNIRPDKSERLVNGIIEGHKLSLSKPNPSTATVIGDQRTETSKSSLHNSVCLNKTQSVLMMEDEIIEASRRPPHPDSKYLCELLTVPKLVVSHENGDEDWLFSKKAPSNKLKFEPIIVEEELLVWSEAVHIESADVLALPYVIPY